MAPRAKISAKNQGKISERPKRLRRRDGSGRLVLVKNAASAKNAKAAKVVIRSGISSRRLMRDPLDARSKVGRAYLARKGALLAHLGGEASVPQLALIDQAARLHLLAQITWAELWRGTPFRPNRDIAPAYDAYRRASADERAVLAMLGIERRKKEIPTLDQYLKQHKSREGDAHGRAEGKE